MSETLWISLRGFVFLFCPIYLFRLYRNNSVERFQKDHPTCATILFLGSFASMGIIIFAGFEFLSSMIIYWDKGDTIEGIRLFQRDYREIFAFIGLGSLILSIYLFLRIEEFFLLKQSVKRLACSEATLIEIMKTTGSYWVPLTREEWEIAENGNPEWLLKQGKKNPLYPFSLQDSKRISEILQARIQFEPQYRTLLGESYATMQQAKAEKTISPEKLRSIISRAEEGDVDAQLFLGSAYCYGQGVLKDHSESAKWYKKAADQGHPIGQRDLGILYKNGLGVSKSNEEAVKLIQKAAEQGEELAQSILGEMFLRGNCGVPQNDILAHMWFSLAGNLNRAELQELSGRLNSQQRSESQQKVIAWQKAFLAEAERGNLYFQCSLGPKYFYGWGFPKDCNESVKWLQKSAEQGDISAKQFLGMMFSHSGALFGEEITLPLDYVLAYMWFSLAANQGDAESILRKAELDKAMSPQLAEEAQEKTKKWLETFGDRQKKVSINSFF